MKVVEHDRLECSKEETIEKIAEFFNAYPEWMPDLSIYTALQEAIRRKLLIERSKYENCTT